MIDKKDEIILAELKKNARAPTKKISSIINIPRVTVHDRIQKLVEKGVIKLFTIIPDYKKINLPTTVFIFLSFTPNHDTSQRKLANRIARMPGVYEVHIVTGQHDLLIKVRGKTMEDIGKLVVERLRFFPGVRTTHTSACFETIKEAHY
jgi:DNA-binding Lrp family transcriptional regulator